LKLSATFSGYESLRNKESDRLNALKINLETFGVELNEVNGMLELKYPDLVEVNKDIIHIQTFNDHRICMSFALLATKGQEIEIDDPECVEKSFPNFWNALRDCNFVLSHG
jgi:3-phosphoshikimate 1-carboxyvinyltransferase